MRTGSSAGVEFQASLATGTSGQGVVTVFGDLDLATAPRLRGMLAQAMDDERDLEIDLRACGFVDSSGIAVLAWAAWQLKDQGRTLKIRGVRPRIMNIFELAGLANHSAIVLEPMKPPE
jgi:anti-sigma B factor antagonist